MYTYSTDDGDGDDNDRHEHSAATANRTRRERRRNISKAVHEQRRPGIIWSKSISMCCASSCVSLCSACARVHVCVHVLLIASLLKTAVQSNPHERKNSFEHAYYGARTRLGQFDSLLLVYSCAPQQWLNSNWRCSCHKLCTYVCVNRWLPQNESQLCFAR